MKRRSILLRLFFIANKMTLQDQIIECVPNFSEGNDAAVIKKITDAVTSVEGVKLMHVDSGKAANRTVVTFAGAPGPVTEAAFRAIKAAAENIDMRLQKGEHPRLGATDVCPLIPIANISMEEVVGYSRMLAKRVGEELDIPVYLYEQSASRPERKNLANVRSGEYEGLVEKIKKDNWIPDYGRAVFNARSGASIIGARDLLIAYNININSDSVDAAKAIAAEIRESGALKRIGDPHTGEIAKDELGSPIRIPGALKEVKAIGWFIKEYGVAQVSINIINYRISPVHIVYEEACKIALKLGLKVTGSELIGLIPLQAMLEAGRFYAEKNSLDSDLNEEELIGLAVKNLGLEEVKPFNPKEKIIDYLL